ncbi:DctP family TRAP transporter solute-binding subunit [Geodermatophilus sp. YIM 151500]|uniref:DctP family TRAP transporter solute-binding subunit n=1 Tax=Geodermatophilus sp. YIM 151500 TaxID=2984531 RepID=UPI0021E39741|nr:DctP family TRAP transporter solute-binding subunit [Geodermatophilus sp. YIM 151500]MCV2488195.1 DctP family TRAP transporter solute-binding subunit [Geodermatophilus sp. YIM 151500]
MNVRVISTVAAAALTLTACGGGGGDSAGSGGAGGGAGGGEEVTLRLAVGDPATSSVGVTAEHFADEVAERSDGRITVEVYPDGTLFGGDQNAAVNQVQNGTIDGTILSTSVYASFEPRMNAISLPYLFDDFDQYVSYLEGEPGQTLLDSLDKVNTEGLAMMTRTFRQVTNSKQPIEDPADLQGLKLRVPNNELWVEFFGALGANPTPMDFTEVYTALQLGVIDGQENPVEVPLANKFYEVQDYLSLTNHIVDGYILGFNADKFAGLDEEAQQILRDAAAETAEYKRQYDDEQADKAIADLEANGMQVNELSAEQMAAFQEEARKLYPQFEDLVGADFVAETLAFVEQG